MILSKRAVRQKNGNKGQEEKQEESIGGGEGEPISAILHAPPVLTTTTTTILNVNNNSNNSSFMLSPIGIVEGSGSGSEGSQRLGKGELVSATIPVSFVLTTTTTTMKYNNRIVLPQLP